MTAISQNFAVGYYTGSINYSKNDIIYSGSFYYSLQDNNSGHNPTGSPTWWTKEFTWLPSYSTSVDMKQRRTEVAFGDGYSQRSRDGINTIPLSYNLAFQGRDDKETRAIMQFIEQKGGVDSFVYDHISVFDATGKKYIAIDPKLTHTSYNLNDINATFIRVFEP